MKTDQEMKLNGVKAYFKVTDYYEGDDLIGIVQTLPEARDLAKQHYKDCDGECNMVISKHVYDEKVGRYVKQLSEYKLWR